MTQSKYSSDLPVFNESEDQFQRFNFSKRIADTITNRKSNDCIVIGIYGSWGEGKTSVLNFIEGELKKDSVHVIMKFNPWRYQDEQMLLLQFFKQLAMSIDAKLKNKKEKVGEFLTRYGGLIGFDIPGLGNLGDSIGKAGSLLNTEDPETLKKRANQLIEQSGKRITIMIDDIDRLDKQEIHTIFRLVKLSADFSNTSYILSFDEKMVAAAIGDRFAEGGSAAGFNFLEKIIQVPLRLPIVRRELIGKFAMMQIDGHLSDNGIALNGYELDRFSDIFKKAILPKLETPRIATRYSNSLSFSVPLLNGEVNIVELMAIEALKIFYPDYYNFVRFNPELILDIRMEKDGEESNHDQTNRILLEMASSPIEAASVKYLLSCIFPVVAGDQNTFLTKDYYYKIQSISAPPYFERYFIYAVIKGDLSDLEVRNFVSNISKQDATVELASLVENYTAEVLLRKMSVINLITEEYQKVKLCVFLCRHLNILIGNGYKASFEFGTIGRLAIETISEIIDSVPDENQKNLMNEIADSINDAHFLVEMIDERIKNEKSSFIREPATEFYHKLLIERIVNISGSNIVFEVFPEYAQKLLEIWSNIEDPSLDKYLELMFDKHPNAFLSILNIFVDHEILQNEFFYKRNLSDSTFDYLAVLLDTNLLAKQIFETYSSEELAIPVQWISKGQTFDEINLARQFLLLKNKTIGTKSPQELSKSS